MNMTFSELPTNLKPFGFETYSKSDEKLSEERVKKIFDFISPKFDKIKSINYMTSSYGIKHIVERNMGEYVSNGELIAAMYLCGFKVEKRAINAHFNISRKSLKRLSSNYQ